MIVLENGAEPPLEFQRDDLIKLSALFAKMAAFASPGAGYRVNLIRGAARATNKTGSAQTPASAQEEPDAPVPSGGN